MRSFLIILSAPLVNVRVDFFQIHLLHPPNNYHGQCVQQLSYFQYQLISQIILYSAQIFI